MPEAWNVEHNNRHHYCLSEVDDPDLVEENLVDLRNMDIPMLAKYAIVLFNMMTWKWFYYAPNTYKELKLARLRRQGKEIPADVHPEYAVTIKTLLTEGSPFYSLWEFFSIVAGPYLVIHFILLPLPLPPTLSNPPPHANPPHRVASQRPLPTDPTSPPPPAM